MLSAQVEVPARRDSEDLSGKGDRLRDLENLIENGLKVFVEVGNALREIRDGRLYKEQGHSTFDAYCRKRWGWSRVHVHRQIEAAGVAEILLPMGNTPLNERQSRELTPLAKDDPEAAREVYAAVLEERGDKLTATDIRQAVRERVEYRETLEALPPKTRDVLTQADENYDKHRNLLRNSNQLSHLLNISERRGDGVAAEVALRALTEERGNVFKAYDEIKREQEKADREAKRKAHRAALREAPPLERRYEVIVADPPWRYDHSETDGRRVENHYPTMDLEEIKALEVPAEEDAVLFMWATSPKLAAALEVMAAWGFGYRTCMVWVKNKIGMGYYARQQHELVLIGKRGDPPVPEPSNRPSSVFHADRARHSAKPEVFYDLVRRMYPNQTKVELFARGTRVGFDGWGDEAEALEVAS